MLHSDHIPTRRQIGDFGQVGEDRSGVSVQTLAVGGAGGVGVEPFAEDSVGRDDTASTWGDARRLQQTYPLWVLSPSQDE
jgi:hypothetical protein